ncbi:MAG: alpha/beta hydrolase [Bacteroidota bacterium]
MKYTLIIPILFVATSIYAQHAKIPLWGNEVPNAKPSEQKEVSDTSNIVRISHVQDPTIEVYLPAKRNATGQAVIICPGGGYSKLAYDWEGIDVAKLLNSHGIAGIVLKYRLPDDDSNMEPHKSPLMDAKQAMSIVRSSAEQWNIDPEKVGIMGFSAGGHLAATLGTHFDALTRPDFMILIYPVISFDESIAHMGSRRNLIGEQPTAELIEYYSNETQVTSDTPPTFLLHASDDKSVPVDNSLVFYKALIEKGIQAEMHIYPEGGHGFGLAVGQGYLATWPDRLIDWIQEQKI